MDNQAPISGSRAAKRLRHVLLGAGCFMLLAAAPTATSLAQGSAQASRNAPAEAVAWVLREPGTLERLRQARDGAELYRELVRP